MTISTHVLDASLGTPEGQAAARDLGHLAPEGADFVFFDTKDL